MSKETISLHGFFCEVDMDQKNSLQEFITNHELFKEWVKIEAENSVYHTVLSNVDTFDKVPYDQFNDLARRRLELNNQLFTVIKDWYEEHVKNKEHHSFGFGTAIKTKIGLT